MTHSVNSTKLSIVVVTYNSQAVLENFLTSLSPAMAGIKAELIVVDNASTDSSLKTLHESSFSAIITKIINNEQNLGFARAANQGAAAAAGEWLLFLNPDLKLDPEAITNMLETVRSEKNVGLTTGRARHADGTFQANCRNLPTYSNLFYSRGSFFKRFLGQGERYTLGDYSSVTEVPALAGTMLMASSKLFEKLGGFDDRFFMFMEDTDLSKRATEAGFRNLFIPKAGSVHYWGGSSPARPNRRRYYHHRSLWQYFRKHSPGLFSFGLLPILLLIHLALSLILQPRRN